MENKFSIVIQGEECHAASKRVQYLSSQFNELQSTGVRHDMRVLDVPEQNITTATLRQWKTENYFITNDELTAKYQNGEK